MAREVGAARAQPPEPLPGEREAVQSQWVGELATVEFAPVESLVPSSIAAEFVAAVQVAVEA